MTRGAAWWRSIFRTRRHMLIAGVLMCSSVALLFVAAWFEGEVVLAPLRAPGCEPLSLRDRFARPLAEFPRACTGAQHDHWTALSDVPELLMRLVVLAEDRRFERHLGVDPLAIARAAYTDLRARRVVSGASTISMQLAWLLDHVAGHRRTLSEKFRQAFRAFALERRLSKPQILEAYVNLAYYGAGAYGIADAARTYFGKPLRALNAGELSLLAVLPRAPTRYDPRHHLERALHRRSQLLQRLQAEGALSPNLVAQVAAQPIVLAAAAREPGPIAGHFFDWVLSQLPARERLAGGVLTTTLDLELQQRLQRLVFEHVAQLSAAGVQQAGLVVLDAQSGEVRGLVGSSDYARAQVDIVTRRRQLGSLLKPFVYALAIEAGESADSVALDIGDVPSAYRARDWVGHEAGPLSYRQALAGSYNLAAVHVLERTSVAALHARLRKAGVATLPAAPTQYGLALALGSARVRLLDVAAGYGFLVRGGWVRPARGIDRLVRSGGATYLPSQRPDVRLFAPEVSAEVMDMLADPAARHLRFGRGLPLDQLDAAPVVAKTGTASGMSDVSAVLACREFIVAAWSGRFDGEPTHGMSGMWGALPLAQRALAIALRGKSPSLPPKPVHALASAADSGAENSTDLAAWAERARASGAHMLRSAR
jgi:penicillin-binding protein 1C